MLMLEAEVYGGTEDLRQFARSSRTEDAWCATLGRVKREIGIKAERITSRVVLLADILDERDGQWAQQDRLLVPN